MASQGQAPKDAALASGLWEEKCILATGETFYLNTLTQETVWERDLEAYLLKEQQLVPSSETKANKPSNPVVESGTASLPKEAARGVVNLGEGQTVAEGLRMAKAMARHGSKPHRYSRHLAMMCVTAEDLQRQPPGEGDATATEEGGKNQSRQTRIFEVPHWVKVDHTTLIPKKGKKNDDDGVGMEQEDSWAMERSETADTSAAARHVDPTSPTTSLSSPSVGTELLEAKYFKAATGINEIQWWQPCFARWTPGVIGSHGDPLPSYYEYRGVATLPIKCDTASTVTTHRKEVYEALLNNTELPASFLAAIKAASAIKKRFIEDYVLDCPEKMKEKKKALKASTSLQEPETSASSLGLAPYTPDGSEVKVMLCPGVNQLVVCVVKPNPNGNSKCPVAGRVRIDTGDNQRAFPLEELKTAMKPKTISTGMSTGRCYSTSKSEISCLEPQVPFIPLFYSPSAAALQTLPSDLIMDIPENVATVNDFVSSSSGSHVTISFPTKYRSSADGDESQGNPRFGLCFHNLNQAKISDPFVPFCACTTGSIIVKGFAFSPDKLTDFVVTPTSTLTQSASTTTAGNQQQQQSSLGPSDYSFFAYLQFCYTADSSAAVGKGPVYQRFPIATSGGRGTLFSPELREMMTANSIKFKYQQPTWQIVLRGHSCSVQMSTTSQSYSTSMSICDESLMSKIGDQVRLALKAQEKQQQQQQQQQRTSAPARTTTGGDGSTSSLLNPSSSSLSPDSTLMQGAEQQVQEVDFVKRQLLTSALRSVETRMRQDEEAEWEKKIKGAAKYEKVESVGDEGNGDAYYTSPSKAQPPAIFSNVNFLQNIVSYLHPDELTTTSRTSMGFRIATLTTGAPILYRHLKKVTTAASNVTTIPSVAYMSAWHSSVSNSNISSSSRKGSDLTLFQRTYQWSLVILSLMGNNFSDGINESERKFQNDLVAGEICSDKTPFHFFMAHVKHYDSPAAVYSLVSMWCHGIKQKHPMQQFRVVTEEEEEMGLGVSAQGSVPIGSRNKMLLQLLATRSNTSENRCYITFLYRFPSFLRQMEKFDSRFLGQCSFDIHPYVVHVHWSLYYKTLLRQATPDTKAGHRYHRNDLLTLIQPPAMAYNFDPAAIRVQFCSDGPNVRLPTMLLASRCPLMAASVAGSRAFAKTKEYEAVHQAAGRTTAVASLAHGMTVQIVDKYHRLPATYQTYLRNCVAGCCDPEGFEEMLFYLFQYAPKVNYKLVHLMVGDCLLKANPTIKVPGLVMRLLQLKGCGHVERTKKKKNEKEAEETATRGSGEEAIEEKEEEGQVSLPHVLLLCRCMKWGYKDVFQLVEEEDEDGDEEGEGEGESGTATRKKRRAAGMLSVLVQTNHIRYVKPILNYFLSAEDSQDRHLLANPQLSDQEPRAYFDHPSSTVEKVAWAKLQAALPVINKTAMTTPSPRDPTGAESMLLRDLERLKKELEAKEMTKRPEYKRVAAVLKHIQAKRTEEGQQQV